MLYLNNFTFPTQKGEESFLDGYYRGTSGCTYHVNPYPFRVLSDVGLFRMDFEPITILCGGNGSGKSTALNVIAQKLRINRSSAYNSGELMDDYVDMCDLQADTNLTAENPGSVGNTARIDDIARIACMVTSDDVFKTMLQDRVRRNQTILESRKLTEQANDPNLDRRIHDILREGLDFETGENVDEFKDFMMMRKMSVSRYLREKLGKEERGMSNGENSFVYMTQLLSSPGLYLLDEPENSLSPDNQMKLSDYLVYMARCNNSQIIMATHSPFLLATPYAKIYNLDASPARICKFAELQSMKTYYQFFSGLQSLFEGK